MFELVLKNDPCEPSVELMSGPRVRLTMSQEECLADVLANFHSSLVSVMTEALHQLYESSEAPHRVFVRDAAGQEVIITWDPCVAYGSQAVVRL